MSLLNLRSGNVAERLKWFQMYIAGVYDGAREEHLVWEAEKSICDELTHRASSVNQELNRLEEFEIGRGASTSNVLAMLRKRWEQVSDIIRDLGVDMGWVEEIEE